MSLTDSAVQIEKKWVIYRGQESGFSMTSPRNLYFVWIPTQQRVGREETVRIKEKESSLFTVAGHLRRGNETGSATTVVCTSHPLRYASVSTSRVDYQQSSVPFTGPLGFGGP